MRTSGNDLENLGSALPRGRSRLLLPALLSLGLMACLGSGPSPRAASAGAGGTSGVVEVHLEQVCLKAVGVDGLDLREVAKIILQSLDVLQAQFRAKLKPDERITLWLFGSKAAYVRKLKEVGDPHPQESSACTLQSTLESYVALAPVVGALPSSSEKLKSIAVWSPVFHELVHQFSYRVLPATRAWPRWLQEGLACWMSAALMRRMSDAPDLLLGSAFRRVQMLYAMNAFKSLGVALAGKIGAQIGELDLYAVSTTVVDFVVEECGGLGRLIELPDSRLIGKAVDCPGKGYDQFLAREFEALWRGFVRSKRPYLCATAFAEWVSADLRVSSSEASSSDLLWFASSMCNARAVELTCRFRLLRCGVRQFNVLVGIEPVGFGELVKFGVDSYGRVGQHTLSSGRWISRDIRSLEPRCRLNDGEWHTLALAIRKDEAVIVIDDSFECAFPFDHDLSGLYGAGCTSGGSVEIAGGLVTITPR